MSCRRGRPRRALALLADQGDRGRRRRYHEWFVEPGQFGLAPAELESVAGGTPEENAAAVRGVLAGEPGRAATSSLLNAAAAIYVGGLAADLDEGVAKAAAAIDSGEAGTVLERLVAATAARSG